MISPCHTDALSVTLSSSSDLYSFHLISLLLDRYKTQWKILQEQGAGHIAPILVNTLVGFRLTLIGCRFTDIYTLIIWYTYCSILIEISIKQALRRVKSAENRLFVQYLIQDSNKEHNPDITRPFRITDVIPHERPATRKVFPGYSSVQATQGLCLQGNHTLTSCHGASHNCATINCYSCLMMHVYASRIAFLSECSPEPTRKQP